MAREIDFDSKLSEEDREYLYQRNKWREVLDNYERFGGPTPIVPKDTPVTGPGSNVAALGPTAITAEQQAEYDRQAASGGGGDASDEDEEVDYESLTVPELRAELDKRKSEGGAELSDEEKSNLTYTTSDKKADLVKRLDRDDELVASKD
jgi:hypothetical protein